MSSNGAVKVCWGYALEGKPPAMLETALASLRREGLEPVPLPSCRGEPCPWIRQVAECLQAGTCQGGVLFCEDPGLACCVANKVAGVRAVAVQTVAQARQAVRRLGANLLVVETRGRTFYELQQMLRLCAQAPAVCPTDVAGVLQELDGYAHR